MAEDTLDFGLDSPEEETADIPESYSTKTKFTLSSRHKSSAVPGATDQQAIFSTSQIVLHDTIIAFLSYVKTFNIPLLPVTKPDIRTVLGQGASFLVNGCEFPQDYTDPATGRVIPKGTVVAMKRARLRHGMKRAVADRIRVIYNELLTMTHPPLAAHPNIVNLVGAGFETEGPMDEMRAVPVLFPECAELGNLADVLETARKEDRPMSFEDKITLVTDVAHGLEILHACDIVHGDVKCENILVFERSNADGPHGSENFNLQCKLTDFGAVQQPSGEIALGGSTPWQAPEVTREAYFKVIEAKRTDIYGLGMLVWRVFLDGNPFQSLGRIEGSTTAEQRTHRNAMISKKKTANTLVSHVCESLALSDQFTKQQLNMLCDVIRATLPNEASQRELSIPELIRRLKFDGWYQERHPVTPSRMPLDVKFDLIDIEKWYSEFEGVSPVVQMDILTDFKDYALSSAGVIQSMDEVERKSTAAYQLAICCANGFGGKFEPQECVKSLAFAAQQGFEKAQIALKSFREAFPDQPSMFKNPFGGNDDDDGNSSLGSSWISEIPVHDRKMTPTASEAGPPARMGELWLIAAQTGDYHGLEACLATARKAKASTDGVTPLHFISSWKLEKARDLGPRLVKAGCDVNAVAERGSTIGGTPLVWSVYGNHLEHTKILLDMGADPTIGSTDGEDALIVAAKLHLDDHLRLLVQYVRPVDTRNHIAAIFEAAAGGDSRFTRISRHSTRWQIAAPSTFDILKEWTHLFCAQTDLPSLVATAVRQGALSPYGRVNTDVQMAFIEKASIPPAKLTDMLGEAVTRYNKDLFDALLDFEVPSTPLYEESRNLLHLCSRIPDHSLAASAFAPRLLKQHVDLSHQDASGLTPWMDAVLERKWDLADLYLKHGANPLCTDKDGFNIIGLCVKTLNLGALKFLIKYSGDKDFGKQFFIINPGKRITSLQLASSMPLPRAHGMKVEVMGTFLTILSNFAQDTEQVDFRSDGILPNATALEIAASKGIVHAVRHLVKKGATLPDKQRMEALTETKDAEKKDYLHKKNLERCIYIIENFHKDPEQTTRLAADWTNLKTIDESKVESSWENVSWDYKNRRSN